MKLFIALTVLSAVWLLALVLYLLVARLRRIRRSGRRYLAHAGSNDIVSPGVVLHAWDDPAHDPVAVAEASARAMYGDRGLPERPVRNNGHDDK